MLILVTAYLFQSITSLKGTIIRQLKNLPLIHVDACPETELRNNDYFCNTIAVFRNNR